MITLVVGQFDDITLLDGGKKVTILSENSKGKILPRR